MSLRRPTVAVLSALVAVGAVVLLSAAPALAVSTVSGTGTGTIMTQGTALAHLDGEPEDVVVVGSFVYVANYDNDVVDVYSESTGAYATSIGVGANPIALAATSDGSEVFVLDQGSPDVEVIQTSTETVVGASTFSVAADPTHIALSPSGTTVYVYFDPSGQTSSYNLTGTLLHTSTVSGVGTGFNIRVSPAGTVYVTYRDSVPSGGDGGLAIMNADLSGATVIPIPSASGLAVSPDGSRLFVGGTTPVTFVGHVGELNTATNTTTGNDAIVGQGPESLVASPNGDWIYAASPSQGDVSVIDRSTFNSVAEGTTGASAIAISPDGLHLYVADRGNGDTDVFSIAQLTVSAAATIAPGTASTPFTVSVADGNPTANDYSSDMVEVNLYDASNTLVGSSTTTLMDASGTITLPIDTSTLPLGVYHATASLSDTQAGHQTLATATGFTVRATLATTGTDASGSVALGIILLSAGSILFALRVSTRRRRAAI